MRAVLVTGADGFIGRHACRWLTNHGWSVRRAVRVADQAHANDPNTVALGDLDKVGQQDLAGALAGCSAVLHLAGRAHVLVDTANNPRAEFERVNVMASLRLAEAATGAGVDRFVFVSSIGVHGSRSRTPLTDTSPLAPVEPYAASKLAAEQQLQELAARTGLELVIVRPPLVYGPHCPGNLARLIRLIQRGWPLPLANVRNPRSFIGVRNLASLLGAALEHDAAAGQVFVAADGEDIGLADLIQTLADGLGVRASLLPFPTPVLALGAWLTGQGATWQKLAGTLQVDASKARRLLDWQPEVTLAEGLRETALSFGPVQSTPGSNAE